jgi:flagellar motility protein MotE (MotC chaperone)
MAQHRPSLRVPMPRLLPMTIIVMAALLAVKSAGLVMAATAPAAAEAVPPAAKPSAEAKPARLEPPRLDLAKPEPAAPVPVAPPPPPSAEPPVSDSERALLTDLRQRRLALDAREANLATREATLAAVEKRLTGRIAELAALQSSLEALERQRAEHDEANWKGLVKVYETMKPHDAALIFNDLDLPVLLPVLDRMKEAKMAAILAAMAPDRARQITTELAQLRARANSIQAAPAPATGPPTMPSPRSSG